MSTYTTLGGKTLAELPQIPTYLVLSGGSGQALATWTNNNTIDGCVNQTQVFINDEWINDIAVASGETTAILTGVTAGVNNIRVAVYQTSTARYYPSRVDSVTVLAVAPSGYIAKWNFENTTVDSVGGYNLNNSNTPTYVTGIIGDAAQLDGLNLSLSTTDTSFTTQINGVQPVSISMFLYADTWANTYNWCGVNSALAAFRMFSGAYLRVQGRNGSWLNLTSNFMPTAGWHHFAYTFDGVDDNNWYYDGGLVKNYTDSTSFGGLTFQPMRTLTSSPGCLYKQDLIYVYDKELTIGEVQLLYNDGAGV